MTDTTNTTEAIFEQHGFIAYVMSVNGPKATGHGETESAAWAACRDTCGPLDVANIIVQPNYSCTLPDLGPAWHDRALRLNEQGYNWEFAGDDPTQWPADAIGYYHNIYTGNPAIFLTGLDSEGAWADPDNNNEPVCLECILAARVRSEAIEGEDQPEDVLEADDYENGTDDEEYKRDLADFQFYYKKLETPGQCWSCLRMIEESANNSPFYEV